MAALMLSSCSLIHSSGPRRTVYIVCMLVALSYIIFDVLDLDGSNFPRLLMPVERSFNIAEASSSPDPLGSPETAPRWFNLRGVSTDASEKFNRFPHTKAVGLTALDWTHHHGYRLGSPQTSAASPFPDD